MSGPRDPWADPDTPTEQGAPYSGPPAYGAVPYPGYGQPGYAQHGWGRPGYPPPGYGWPVPPPRAPRRPGQVITAAVLALVQAALVAFTSAYLLLFANILGLDLDTDGVIDPRAAALADEARVLAWVQFASVVALVAAGVLALNRRDRGTWLGLLVALGWQLLLALYWAVRIVGVLEDIPGPDDAVPVLVFGALVFAAGPAVGVGLLLSRSSRQWFGTGQGSGRP